MLDMANPTKYHRVYAQNRRTRPAPCAHWRVLLIGNEETGLSSIECEDCGEPLVRRRNAAGEYDYFTASEER